MHSTSKYIIMLYCCKIDVCTMQGLKELVSNEEQVLFQTSNALSQCVKSAAGSGTLFIGSAEAVECHRLLLIASTLFCIYVLVLRVPVL